jgi:predicted DNA-binding protein
MVSVKDGFKRTTINLRLEEYETLRFLAFKRKTSVAGLVRELIKEVLEDEEDIRDGLKSLKQKGDTLDWATFKKERLGIQA